MPLWKRNLLVMVIVQFTATGAFQLVTPFLPFFIVELGITDPQSLKIWTGILPSINALFAGLLAPVWGNLSDRYGCKPMLIRSVASVAIFCVLPAFVLNVYQLLACRVFLGIFSGFSAAALSLAASITPEHRLGYALGWLQTGQVLGLVIGPLLGGALADIFPFRTVFLLAGLLATIGTVLAITLIHEEFHPDNISPAATKKQKRLHSLFSWPLAIYIMFVVIFLSQFATRGVEPFLPLYVRELAGSKSALNTITGTVIAITGLGMIIAATVLGRFAPFWGYKHCLLACLAGTALFFIPQALIGHVIPLIILRFCQGLFLGGLLPMANSLVGLLITPEKRGSVYGLTSSAFFLGNFSGPLVGGLWTALFGLRSIFYAASLLLLLNLFWVWWKVQEPQKTIVKVTLK